MNALMMSGSKIVGVLSLLAVMMMPNVRSAEQVPEGWEKGGSHPQDYAISTDAAESGEGSPCYKIESIASQPKGFVSLKQVTQAQDYLGQRIRVTAEIRVSGVDGWAGLWLRIDGSDKKSLVFDNMGDRPIKGTSDWNRYEMTCYAPPGGVTVVHGLIFNGKGQVWVRNLKLEALAFEAKDLEALAGNWKGTLEVGPMALRVFFVFEEGEAHRLWSYFASPDQSETRMPVTQIALTGNTVEFGVPSIGGTYKGQWDRASHEIKGTWKQAGLACPLTMVFTETDWKLRRPQTPKPPFPYSTEDVVFENVKAKVRLAGTLTRPEGKGPFPALVLISGSGPQDRDEMLFGHKPFAVIADYLSRAGYAVLRYDDRGWGKSTGDFRSATSEDFSYDAEVALDYLKTRREIDRKWIGFLGHSEGGLIAPMIAARRADVGFLILLAAPGIAGEELAMAQVDTAFRMLGFSEEYIQSCGPLTRETMQISRSDLSDIEKKRKLNELEQKTISLMGETDKRVYDKFKDKIEASREFGMNHLISPWMQFFLRYDPANDLKRVQCPVLALNGQLDTQVLAMENLSAIEKHLKGGGNARVTVQELKGLNHLFQTAQTGVLKEYGEIEETFSPSALSEILTWLRANVSLLK
jgi:pimeloyl-ACP methyl ester carboxylesterase